MLKLFLAQDGFQIRFRRACRVDIEVFYKVVEDVRSYEGRQRRSEIEILEAQCKQRQEDTDSLLFVP